MKYKVVKAFRDRYSNFKTFYPGDTHEPPNEERAKQLLELGFIEKMKPLKRKKDETP